MIFRLKCTSISNSTVLYCSLVYENANASLRRTQNASFEAREYSYTQTQSKSSSRRKSTRETRYACRARESGAVISELIMPLTSSHA